MHAWHSKGVDSSKKGLTLISDLIGRTLGIEVSVLMGANIANEVAESQFCESTLGCRSPEAGKMFRLLFDRPYFRISCIDDVEGVELCGALKNIVAVAAGLVEGLGLGENTKAAIIRIGLMEMKCFAELMYGSGRWETYFESCGIADLITSCSGGRNKRLAAAHVTTGKSFETLETEMLDGQKLQGPLTSRDVYEILLEKKKTASFPLFVAVYRVCHEHLHAQSFLDCLASRSQTDRTDCSL